MTVLAVGLDLVDIARAAAMLDRHGVRILERLLLPAERRYVESSAAPARHFAARLAAKEATYKALQLVPAARVIGWRELELVRGEAGRPGLVLHGRAAEVAAAVGPLRLHVSVTHSELSAAAVVIAVRA